MADRKISDLTALTTPAAGDFLPIVDISEAAAADKNKRITIEELMRGAPDGTAAAPGIAFETDPNTGIFSPGADQLAIATAGSERLRINSTGRVLVATTTQIPTQFPSFFQTDGSLGYAADFGRFTNDSFGAYISFVHGRGTSPSARGIVQNGDSLGVIDFMGDDGVTLNPIGAQILAAVDGTPGVNDMPGRLVFSTTADGASNPTERMRITSTGRLGIGNSAPLNRLDVQTSVDGVATVARFYNLSNVSAATQAAIDLQADQSTSRISSLRDGAGTSATTIISNTAAGVMGERLRIDSSGRVLVGTSNPYGTATLIEMHSATQFGPQLLLRSLRNDAFGPYVVGHKIRSSSIVQSGDTLITVAGEGFDGVTFPTAARIELQVDGTPGANDMPGRIVFSTTADGAASPTERLRITSAGVLQIADAGNIQVGTTTGTKIGTATTQKLGFYNATPVVQPAAVANATTSVDVITQLNDLLAKLRTLGIIAT
jgi:hypothetical protein